MSNKMKNFTIVFTIVWLIILLGPFLVPVPPLEGTQPIEALADPDSQFIEVNNLSIHYKLDGKGEPAIILLHGFASSNFSWREVIKPLSSFGTVIAFDRPAFGLTERPMEWDGENPYSTEYQAKLVVGLMDKFHIDQAILVGNSAGGSIAALTALNYPQRVKALVLVDAAIYSGGGSPSWAAWLIKTPQVQHIGPLIARRIKDWGVDFAQSAWHNPDLINEQIWEGYNKPLMAENWDQALWHLTAASKELNLDQRLNELTLPVLVITGDDDRIVPTPDSIQLAKDIAGAELAVIPECGHVPQEECPQAFLEFTTDFISRLP